MALTLEEATLWVAEAVSPLQQRLAPATAPQFLSEIGLPASDTVGRAPTVVAATARAAAAAAAVAPHVPALTTAIAGQDVDKIGRALGKATPAVAELVTAVQGLAAAVGGAAPAGFGGAAVRAFAEELPGRLFSFLFSEYLARAAPTAHHLAELLGLIELTEVGARGPVPAHLRRVVRFDRTGQLLRDPSAVFTEVYGWGTPDFDWDLFLRRLFHVMTVTGFGFVERDPAGGPAVLRIALVDIGPTDDPVPGLRATTRAEVAAGSSLRQPLGGSLSWEAATAAQLETSAALELHPPADFHVVPPEVAASGEVTVGLTIEDPSGRPTLLLGTAGGTRVEAGSLRAKASTDLEWELTAGRAVGELVVSATIADGLVVLDLSAADGFLAALLPRDGLPLKVDLGLAWSSRRGLRVEGGAGLEVDLPVELELGPVRVLSLHLALTVGAQGITLETSGAVAARLGPVALAIDGVGALTVLSFPRAGGNLGTADLAVRFKPPEGIGLAVDAGAVRGGGFLGISADGTEYSGVLELSLGPVSVKAVGILTTDLPDGGWALLLLVFSEFSAVQLGYGFTLNGVGGVIGLQHGVSTQALQSGLRTGVLDSVLFPVNPVANAPQLLSQLRAVFPITPRALVVGPVLKIGWSTPPLITISLGLVLQFDDVLGAVGPPQLTRVVLLGQLKIQVPPDTGETVPTVLKLLVDIVGSYELRERALALDARLRDSHIAGLPLTGSLVVRARFGAEPAFILAVGGFHPRFTDLPPGLPPQDRVGFQLAYDMVTVRVVGYTAVTSNTFQIGAEASLVAAAAGFRVDAHLGFDALFVFTPRFQFVIDFRVGASIKYKSHSLASVDVRGILSGPARWVVTGHASFKVLFWRVGIDFEVAWGVQPAVPVATVDVRPLLVEALEDPANWQAELPARGDALVTLRQPAVNGVLAHPLGELSVIQRVVPLGVDIDRVGTARPSDGNRFDITAVEIGVPGSPGFRSGQPTYREEHFPRGEYLDLTEEEKLSAPSFERFRAGAALSSDAYVAGGSQVAYDPDFETLYLDEPDERDVGRLPADLLTTFAHYGAAASAELRAGEKLAADRSLSVTVTEPVFAVADAAGLTALTPEVFTSQTLAAQASAAAPGQTVAVELAELLGAP